MRRRPTIAEARIKRHMHRAARRAQVATRKAAHVAHRGGLHTVASHLRAMGADDATATGMAASIRKKLTGGVRGFARKDGQRRACTRYTRSQILAALVTYKPRKKAFQAFRDIALAA